MTTQSRRWLPAVLLTVLALVGGLSTLSFAADEATDEMQFTDVKKQTAEFMGYYESIQLTDEQEKVKADALTAIPAPCCSNNTAYTCCCPCNMAKSNWGLSHYLITEKGYDADQVRATVSRWIEFINPDGFSGDVCYSRGGCMRPFAENGCGGMGAHVSWGS